jgi:uncharacterized protein YecE (DUF72 family)
MHTHTRKSTMYIGTHEYFFEEWTENDVFYPKDIDNDDMLAYYCTKFDTVEIGVCSCKGAPDRYHNLISNVKKNKKFKFTIIPPDELFDPDTADVETIWQAFWKGDDLNDSPFSQSSDDDSSESDSYCVRSTNNPHSVRSSTNESSLRSNIQGYRSDGCEVLHKAGKLLCVLFLFPPSFQFNKKNYKRVKLYRQLCPPDVMLAFEFLNIGWWSKQASDLLKKQKRVCTVIPYVENGTLYAGWAGNTPSTRTLSNSSLDINIISTSSDLIYLRLYGTYGQYTGSYDRNNFLENFTNKLREYETKYKQVVCIFSNHATTFQKQLPVLSVFMFEFEPFYQKLPQYADTDKPCCLHDSLRLKTLLKKTQTIKGVPRTEPRSRGITQHNSRVARSSEDDSKKEHSNEVKNKSDQEKKTIRFNFIK